MCCKSGISFDPILYIKNELDNGSKNIVVRSGVYKIETKDSVYLTLKDLSDVTIDFTDVEFIGLVRTQMLEIVNCSNLTLKGLTIDYDPLPYTQGYITEIDVEQNWTVQVIKGYPAEDVKSADVCWPIQVYDRDNLELVNPMRFSNNVDVTRTGKDTYRITGGENREGKLGDIVVFTSPGKRSVAIQSINCANLQFDRFTLYSTPGGVAFREVGNKKSIYSGCVIDRRPWELDIAERDFKRLRSGSHDAFVCKNALIGPQIIGCTARYHCDDCVNISGVYSLVVGAEGGEFRILDGHPILPQGIGISIAVGDSVQIMTKDGQRLEDGVVLALKSDGDRTEQEAELIEQLGLWPGLSKGFKHAFRIKLDREYLLPPGSLIISNNQCCNGFLVKDCTFGSTRARGLLIKASDGVIENNTIENSCALGIVVATEYIWMSGGCSSNISIIGNNIVDSWNGGIHIGSKPFYENSHQNITIKNNNIKTSTTGIQVNGCTGLEISGNYVEVVKGVNEQGILLENVVDVKEKNNSVAYSEKMKKI